MRKSDPPWLVPLVATGLSLCTAFFACISSNLFRSQIWDMPAFMYRMLTFISEPAALWLHEHYAEFEEAVISGTANVANRLNIEAWVLVLFSFLTLVSAGVFASGVKKIREIYKTTFVIYSLLKEHPHRRVNLEKLGQAAHIALTANILGFFMFWLQLDFLPMLLCATGMVVLYGGGRVYKSRLTRWERECFTIQTITMSVGRKDGETADIG